MSKFNNIINNVSNITTLVDFINNVLILEDVDNVLEFLVSKAELNTEQEKNDFLYDVFDYIVRAYKSSPTKTFLSHNEETIKEYFGNIITKYNSLTKSNYNSLHKDIWYAALNIIIDDNPRDITQLLKDIITDINFDNCEYRHKTFLLGLQIQMLITCNPIDLQQLNLVSSKLKELNNQNR